MFREEAVWIKSVLQNLQPLPQNKHAANLGSSTGTFRKKVQPHIHENVIAVLESNGWLVTHADAKMDEGVDIAADLTDAAFGQRYSNAFALTICTNMLEHVEDISAAIKNLLSVTCADGYLLITVPYKYKLHNDPIDNGLRPTPAEIEKLFPNGAVKCIHAGIITIHEKEYYKIKRSKFFLWGYRERLMYYAGKRYKVSGILLRVVQKSKA
ncbi:MAG TPA: hypothetical protein PL045_04770 [Chitinophagaceae bacterium]|nr:hypothetical protein [Chitinophagaceae bacterium]